MELVLLGTAAAEGIPASYCDCPICTEARRRGGPNIRMRSGALIDDDLKIDHNPDNVVHMQRLGRSLGKVRTIVFTHQHGDHFYPIDLKRVAPPSTLTRSSEPIAVYGNEQVLAEIRRVFPDPMALKLDLHLLRPLETVVTLAGDTVLPMTATHDEGSLVLRITRAGKSIFYGHDSGYYKPATLDALSDGVPLDIALMDATNGLHPSQCVAHLNFDGLIRMVDELRRRGAITDKTHVIATHFSHNGLILHEELAYKLLPYRIEVAFDGMVVKV